MAKNFDLEIRQSPREKYLKATFKKDTDLDNIKNYLTDLESVRTVNITDQGRGRKDLTLYTQKTYDIDEMKTEVESALNQYFTGSPLDPKKKKQIISGVSDHAYFEVLDHILAIGKEMEATLRLTADWGEERYRDFIIAGLNRTYSGFRASGETYHKTGKTDILYADNAGNNLLIAECKLWKGEQYLQEAIDQLINRYISWRDEKAAIIIFNKDNKNFTEVVRKAVQVIQGHPLCIEAKGQRKETSYSFILRNPNDAEKTIKLELVLLTFV